MGDLVQDYLKTGEAVVVVWKKKDESACGGTEGVLLGVTGDRVTGEYLVMERSTYQDSFKSALSLLEILDLKVIPTNDVELIRKADLRRRPPGIFESFKMKMEVDYESNVDFDATYVKIQKRTDCKVTPSCSSKSDAVYGVGIREIQAVEGASVTISSGGALQIFCSYEGFDDCIQWIQEAVELLQGHKRLVLFPAKVMFSIHDTYKEESRPTEEVIRRIANARDGQPIVLPIGWAHRFFVELDENPLQGLFPTDQPLENFVLENKEGKKNVTLSPEKSIGKESKQCGDLRFRWSEVKINRFLGAGAPTVRITGLVKSSKDEESLMQMWLKSRSDPWQWFDNGQIHGKMIIRDLTIDRKTGTYTVDLQKYSGNEF